VAENVSAAAAVHARIEEGARRAKARDLIATEVRLFGRGALTEARDARIAGVSFGAAVFIFPTQRAMWAGDCA